ncbi:MAG: hypothetical protein OEY79_01575, partial [Anaplasmataceae bacterium]|nr:hypothetical protein [Anaplasmataceae bacterium]
MISYISDIIYLSVNIEVDIRISEYIYIQILPFIDNKSDYKALYNDYLDNLIVKILNTVSNRTTRYKISDVVYKEELNISDIFNKLINDDKQILVLDKEFIQACQPDDKKYCDDCNLFLNIVFFLLLKNKVNLIYILKYYNFNKEETNFYKIISIINNFCSEEIKIDSLFLLNNIITSNLNNLFYDFKKIIDANISYSEVVIQSINIFKKITDIQNETEELIDFLLMIIDVNNIGRISSMQFIEILEFIVGIYSYKVCKYHKFTAPYDDISNCTLVCKKNSLISNIQKRLKLNFQPIIIKNNQQNEIIKNSLYFNNDKQDIDQMSISDLYDLRLFIDNPDIFYKQHLLQIKNEYKYSYSLKGNVINIIKYYHSLQKNISYIDKLKLVIREIKNNLSVIGINIFLYKVYKIKIFFLLQKYFELINVKNISINYILYSFTWNKLLINYKYIIANQDKSLDIIIYTTNANKKSNFLIPYFFYSMRDIEINNIIIYEISNKSIKREVCIINDKIIDI